MVETEKKMGIGIRVMILKDGKILLGKRRSNPEKAGNPLHGGGTWTMPGGKVDFAENLEEAMVREVKEETGLSISENSFKLISVAHDLVNNVQFITLGFLTEEYEGEVELPNSGEYTEFEWFALDKLPEQLFFPTAKVLNNYFDKKIY